MIDKDFYPEDWSVNEYCWLEGHVSIDSPTHGSLAVVVSEMDDSTSTIELQTNIHLIRTSPEMYKEIKRDTEWLCRMITTHGEEHPMTPMFKDMLCDKERLLLKARGYYYD